ncbi:MAG: hypothetical protein MUC96_20155 [Myxococcaceae bacterium]|nr:hypothetical protein [Myxococcaceae bacterium]
MRVLTSACLSLLLTQVAFPPLGAPPLSFGTPGSIAFKPTRREAAVALWSNRVAVVWTDRRRSFTGLELEDFSSAVFEFADGGFRLLDRGVGTAQPGIAARFPALDFANGTVVLGGQYEITNRMLTGVDAGERISWAARSSSDDRFILMTADAGYPASPPSVAAFPLAGAVFRQNDQLLLFSLRPDGSDTGATVLATGISGTPRIVPVGSQFIIAATKPSTGTASGTAFDWLSADRSRLAEHGPGELVGLVSLASGHRLAVLLQADRTVFKSSDGSEVTSDVLAEYAAPFGVGAVAIGRRPLDMRQTLLQLSEPRSPPRPQQWIGGDVVALAGNATGAVAVEQASFGLALRRIEPLVDGGLDPATATTLITESARTQRGPKAVWDRRRARFLMAWDEIVLPDEWRTERAAISLDGTVELEPPIDSRSFVQGTFPHLISSAAGDALALSRTSEALWVLQQLSEDGSNAADELLRGTLPAWTPSFDPVFSIAFRQTDGGLAVIDSVDGVQPQPNVLTGARGARCAAVLRGEHWLPHWRATGLSFEVFSPDGGQRAVSTTVRDVGGSLCATRIDDDRLFLTWASADTVHFGTVRPESDGGVAPFVPGELRVDGPLAPVGAAVVDGVVLAWSAGRGARIEAMLVPHDGGTPLAPVALRSGGDLAGGPTVSAAPTTNVALVAWEEFDKALGAFRVAARLIRQGVRVDAGVIDAGVTLTSPDAGDGDAGLPDTPIPDAGLPLPAFSPNACGCGAGPSASVLTLLACWFVRRRPRGARRPS